MNLTDTHCHLADPALRENLPHVLTAAREAGVGRFIVPATRPQDWQDVVDLAQRSSENPVLNFRRPQFKIISSGRKIAPFFFGYKLRI